MDITFVTPDDARVTVPARAGLSVMEVALQHGIEGIDAECGGGCACGTCHVYVDQRWSDKIEPKSPVEADMLEIVADLQPNSQLSCQLKLTEALDGLVLTIPASQ